MGRPSELEISVVANAIGYALHGDDGVTPSVEISMEQADKYVKAAERAITQLDILRSK